MCSQPHRQQYWQCSKTQGGTGRGASPQEHPPTLAAAAAAEAAAAASCNCLCISCHCSCRCSWELQQLLELQLQLPLQLPLQHRLQLQLQHHIFKFQLQHNTQWFHTSCAPRTFHMVAAVLDLLMHARSIPKTGCKAVLASLLCTHHQGTAGTHQQVMMHT